MHDFVRRKMGVAGFILVGFVVLLAERRVSALPSAITCGQSAVYMPPGNGSFPARAGDFPWLVRLAIAKEEMCTASIISNEWLFSAANCFLTNKSELIFTGDILAYIGEVTLSLSDSSESIVAIDRIVIHPNHDEISGHYNFALLHLAEPLTFSDVAKPICLIEDCIDENAQNSICVIGGWGSDHVLFNASSTPYDHLRKSNVPLADRRTCGMALESKTDVGDIEFTDDMTCAGYEEGFVDDCRSDSGGPLVCRSMADNTYYLHGINSFGYGCNQRPGYYHVFARPCHVMSWVRNVTGFNQPRAPLPPWSSPSSSVLFPAQSLNPGGNRPGTSNNNNNGPLQAGPGTNNNYWSQGQGQYQPAAVTPMPRKVTRLLLTSDENAEASQCGQNKYAMMAAGRVPRPRPALILEYPWQVRIHLSAFDSVTPFTCAASLIEDYWVITSARCILTAKQEGMTSMVANFGEYDLNRPTGNERSVPVVREFVHPGYDLENYDYDFALLRLSERVRFSDATRPICLLADCDVKPEDDKPTNCLTVGWRTIANRKTDPARNPLEVVAVNVTSESECKNVLGQVEYTDRKLCVSANGRPACQVDAGGPLMCKMANEDAYFLHGIASYTQRGCTYRDTCVVYVRPCFVGRWIQDTVRGYDDNPPPLV